MLELFGITNFKALASATVRLGAVTVLIGPNGTGKSSVLQALILLKQSRGQGALVTSGESLRLGRYDEVVHKPPRGGYARQPIGNVEFRLEGSFPAFSRNRSAPPISSARPTSETYTVTFDPSGLLRHETEIVGQDIQIAGSWHRVSGGEVSPQVIPLQFRELDAGQVGLTLQASVAQAVAPGGWSFPQGLDPSVVLTTQVELQNIFLGFHELLTKTYLIPPLRGVSSPDCPLLDEPPSDFLTSAGPDEYASRVLSTVAYQRDLETSISRFSKQSLGVKMRARLTPGRRVSAEAYNGSTTNLVNEGFGANQLMLLLAQCVIAPAGSLLGIEEPEIHLHPRAQNKLAEILVELVKGQHKQLILTTHSEHVLMGLLTEVASGRLQPGELSVYYFYKDKKGLATQQRLAVDDQGRLKGGLKGFFEANIDELEHYLKALSLPRTR